MFATLGTMANKGGRITGDVNPITVNRRALRTIATFEAVKGFAALAASVGLFSLLHHDLHHIAEALIGHVGLDPGSHYPALFLHDVDMLRDTHVQSLMLAASAYVIVRMFEAYGLWHELGWGEWLGALSGAVYIPFELRHLLHRPTLAAGAVIACNVSVVGFLAWQLWRQRRGSGA
jgi:uncharacterized membrane protein (DUF2068 family)